MNKVFLFGNLGNEPELRHFATGPNLRFRMATTEVWRDKQGESQERTEWHNVTLWGKRAESLACLLNKGSQVMVEGRLETRSYEAGGVTKYVTEVRARDVHLSGHVRSATRGQALEQQVEALSA